ncbi:hypothetical protein MPSEU_000594400 [Mayamaea pseudoterrestris]|nr:hypothetical protein MPSEU_000594400 [Mayamaea pseudoterrestris]
MAAARTDHFSIDTQDSMGLKENNGRAARRKTMHRIGWIAVAFLVVLIILFKPFGGGSKAEEHRQRRQELAQRLRKFASEAVNANPIHAMQQKLGSHDSSGTNAWKSDTEEVLEQIVQARLHLVDIRSDTSSLSTAAKGDYSGVYGSFCRLDWSIHKQDPSATPMFRDLVSKSPDCAHPRTVPLKVAAEAVREYDSKHQDHGDSVSDMSTQVPKVLNLTAVAFHESRCGSTLVANLCVSADPAKHRVYSESAPPINALRNTCGDSYQHCSQETAAKILQDVIYLMSRSDDVHESRVFFKIQSIGTLQLRLFQYAFPETPWLFVFREPVQVMMSHLENGVKYANCVRTQRFPPLAIQEVIRKHHVASAGSMAPEAYCAAHLASLTEAASEALNEAGSKGMAVDYKDLPDAFVHEILPSLLGYELSEAMIRRMQETGGQYSKGRGNKAGEFKGDSEKKERKATDAIREAAETFLTTSYEALVKSATERKRLLTSNR